MSLNDAQKDPGNERKGQPEIKTIHHRLMDDAELRDWEKVLGVHRENCLHVVAYYCA